MKRKAAAAVAPKRRESERRESERRESELTAWLALDDAAFIENARRFASAKGRPARDRLLRNGLAGEFAARLLTQARGDSQRQIESWKLVGQLWADEPWRTHLRAAGVESAPPSPRSFVNVPLAPIVQALLGLYGKDALPWCAYAYLIRSGPAAAAISEAIVGYATPLDAIVEAIEAALTELEAEPDFHPGGISGRVANLLVASLLAQRLAMTAAPRPDASAVAKIGSLVFSREQAATLIQALIAAQLRADGSPGGSLDHALAETAWIEADDALARALQQTPALREAIREPAGLSPLLRSQIGAIIQAVRTSAAKRELEIEGIPGSEAAFDPVRHSNDDPRVKPMSRIRLVTPTVFQGRGANRRVLRAADVEPA
jgi:hypothetical protein